MNNVNAALESLHQLSSSFHATKLLSSEQLQTYGELKSLETILQLLGHRLSDDNALLLQLNVILGAKIDLGHCSFTTDEQRVIAAVIEELKGQLILGAQQSHEPTPSAGQHIIANQGAQSSAEIYLDAKDNSFGDVTGSVFSHNQITFNADPAVRGGVDKLVERTTDAQNRAFGDWISTLDFEQIQQDTLSKQASGTCSWFIEEASFQSWVNGEIKFLWCPGNPGVGKTILASSIIDHLQRSVTQANIGVVYLYCDYAQRTNQTTTELLGSILKQLVHNQRAISKQLISLHEASRNTRPSLSDLQRALEAQVALYSSVYIVVDALDECSDIDATRETFMDALQSLPATVHLLVTSRDIFSIAQQFIGKPRIEVRARDEDLRTYIKGRLVSESRIARLLKGDAELQEEIISQVISKAAGMFLLAQLHIDSLASKHSRKALRASLQTLPKEINNSYDETMRRIKAQGEDDCTLAHQVFMWLTYVQRPLKMRELQYALAVSPEMTEMEEDAIVDVELLTAVCAGLVIVEEVSTVVRLVHYTTQQYFELQQESLFPNPHSSIAISCVQYLTFDVYSWYYSFRTFQTLLEQHPLLEYAARYWGIHSSRDEAAVRRYILDFLKDEEKFRWAVKVFVESRSPQPLVGMPVNLVSRTHVLAMFGLHQTLELLLDDDSEAGDSLDSHGSTPLFHAAEQGHIRVAELLLKRAPNSTDFANKSCLTPLLIAADRGRDGVVKLLVGSKLVNIEARDKAGRTALLVGAIHDNIDFGTALLEAGAFVNQKCSHLRTPLSYAAQYGYSDFVQLLLEQPAVDINDQDLHGRTALSYAAHGGHVAVVKQFLQCESIKPNLASDAGVTPLIYSAQRGDEAVSQLLLDHKDVNPDSRDYRRMTALAYAAERGHTGVVRLLLAKDNVTADSQDENLRTPLSYAIQSGHTDIIDLLRQRPDVNPHCKDVYSLTPIYYARVLKPIDTNYRSTASLTFWEQPSNRFVNPPPAPTGYGPISPVLVGSGFSAYPYYEKSRRGYSFGEIAEA